MSSATAHIAAPSERKSHDARRSSLANPRTASSAAAPSTSPMQTQLEKKSRTPSPPTPSATATYAAKTTSSSAHAILMARRPGFRWFKPYLLQAKVTSANCGDKRRGGSVDAYASQRSPSATAEPEAPDSCA